MKTVSITEKKEKSSWARISVARVAVLGMFLALLIAFKYALGFIPGVEIVSFMFIVFGMFLPILDLTLLVVCFNLLIVVIYGFGGWWFAYWIIWPIDAFLSKGLSKLTKNRFAFGLFGFLAGMSVMFWYFLSDMFFFGKSFAVMNLISAIPINTIEGFVTMFMIITVAPKLLKVINMYAPTIWGEKHCYKFNDIKHKKTGYFMVWFLSLGAIAGSVTMFVKNDFFLSWKSREIRNNLSSGHINNQNDVPNGWGALSVTDYNKIYDNLDDNEIAIVIIANQNSFVEEVNISDGETLERAILSMTQYEFKLYDSGDTLGRFIQTYRPVGTTTWLHGTAQSQNYGDYYPMILIDHNYSSLGATSLVVEGKDIIEITYDHNA